MPVPQCILGWGAVETQIVPLSVTDIQIESNYIQGPIYKCNYTQKLPTIRPDLDGEMLDFNLVTG